MKITVTQIKKAINTSNINNYGFLTVLRKDKGVYTIKTLTGEDVIAKVYLTKEQDEISLISFNVYVTKQMIVDLFERLEQYTHYDRTAIQYKDENLKVVKRDSSNSLHEFISKLIKEIDLEELEEFILESDLDEEELEEHQDFKEEMIACINGLYIEGSKGLSVKPTEETQVEIENKIRARRVQDKKQAEEYMKNSKAVTVLDKATPKTELNVKVFKDMTDKIKTEENHKEIDKKIFETIKGLNYSNEEERKAIDLHHECQALGTAIHRAVEVKDVKAYDLFEQYLDKRLERNEEVNKLTHSHNAKALEEESNMNKENNLEELRTRLEELEKERSHKACYVNNETLQVIKDNISNVRIEIAVILNENLINELEDKGLYVREYENEANIYNKETNKVVGYLSLSYEDMLLIDYELVITKVEEFEELFGEANDNGNKEYSEACAKVVTELCSYEETEKRVKETMANIDLDDCIKEASKKTHSPQVVEPVDIDDLPVEEYEEAKRIQEENKETMEDIKQRTQINRMKSFLKSVGVEVEEERLLTLTIEELERIVNGEEEQEENSNTETPKTLKAQVERAKKVFANASKTKELDKSIEDCKGRIEFEESYKKKCYQDKNRRAFNAATCKMSTLNNKLEELKKEKRKLQSEATREHNASVKAQAIKESGRVGNDLTSGDDIVF